LINKSGLLDAERILANHQAKIVELRSTLEINLATLLNKVGGGEKISKISEDLSQFRKVVCDEESLPSLEKLFEMAYQKRNDIKAQEAKIQSHQNNLKVVNSKRYPEVNLGANYYYRGDFSNSDNKSWAWNVLFRLDWYLFDFGETSAKVAQQKDLILAQQEVLRALKNVIVLQVQTSYQTIISFGARLTGLKKSIEQAKETLAMTEEKYKKAFLTEVDVLKARDQLNQVEQTYYETEIDLIVNRVALKKAIGLDIPVSYGL
jgi:outer membrane protein TolC